MSERGRERRESERERERERGEGGNSHRSHTQSLPYSGKFLREKTFTKTNAKKTFTNASKSTKFAKDFESFPLDGICVF